MRRCILIPLFLTALSGIQAQVTYLEAKADAGEGVLALLRRFQLDGYSCNVSQFYLINRMEKTDGLIHGQTYQLPVRRHRYNKRSISTTIGITDIDLSVRNQDFNRSMEKKG